jgi:hypothetical protein
MEKWKSDPTTLILDPWLVVAYFFTSDCYNSDAVLIHKIVAQFHLGIPMMLTRVFSPHARVSFVILLFLILFSTVTLLHAEETGFTGAYLEIGGQTDPNSIGIGFGGFKYNYRYLTTRMALYVLGSESVDDVFLGADAGVRMELGTRVSPLVGLGGYYGYHSDQVPAENDNLDNDGDGQVDEGGEKDAPGPMPSSS